MKKIIHVLFVIGDFVAWLFGVKVLYRCGHRDMRRFKITLFGTDLGRFSDPGLKREYCPACELAYLERTSIRCADADCGRPILMGSAICVIIPLPEYKIGPWAHRRCDSVVYGACCGCGSDYSGNWGYGPYELPKTATAA